LDENSLGAVGGEVNLRTVAVIALKGGSGKTTVATHLALAAHLRGLDTLLVDIDPQHSSRDVLGSRDGPGPACVTSSGSTLLAAQFAAVGVHKDLLIIDTAAGAVENVSEAIVLADLAVMVVRPTLLDIAGLARTFSIVRRLGKPATVVVNQAPVPREGVEDAAGQAGVAGARLHEGARGARHPAVAVDLSDRAGAGPLGGRNAGPCGRQGNSRPLGLSSKPRSRSGARTPSGRDRGAPRTPLARRGERVPMLRSTRTRRGARWA